MPITVRPERSGDYDAVRAVHTRAFDRSDEADLVDRLRRLVDPYIALVAVSDGPVVGHIFFSPVHLNGSDGPPYVMGLAPMAVRPEDQRRGIGTRLVRDGLGACAERGVDAVVVLGHPDYYPRFGFRPAHRFGLDSEYDVPDDAFMACELTTGALDDVRGLVAYHDAFASI